MPYEQYKNIFLKENVKKLQKTKVKFYYFIRYSLYKIYLIWSMKLINHSTFICEKWYKKYIVLLHPKNMLYVYMLQRSQL